MSFLESYWLAVQNYAANVAGMMTSERTMILAGFAVFVLLCDVAVRRSFSWPWRLVKSAAASAAIYNINLLFIPAVYLIAHAAESAYDSFGIPHVDEQFWSTVPYWLLVVVSVLAHDFADYWNHRLMHTVNWLWPIHAIHHSDPDMTCLTTFRVHFLEALVMLLSYTVLLTWMGIPAGVLGAGAVLITIHNMYVHINVDWGHGPLRHIIASPRFHRWHHANEPEIYGKNLANIFPFYDIIFGTYHVPSAYKGKLGADGVPENNVLQLMMYPFTQWSEMIAGAIHKARGKSGESDSTDNSGNQVSAPPRTEPAQ